VAIIGGELVGCETAEFLAAEGKKVTVLRRSQEMALKVGPSLRNFLLSRLTEKGVALLPGVNYEKVGPDGLVITTREGEKKTIAADTIVLASGSLPDRALFQELKGKRPEVHCIGDCVAPRMIRDAIAEGFRLGLEI
jgi:pyruvate/2-oxoglutarate dehydrogenase complex dihydrolipoamide dehydrogenase (E3) component